MNRRGFALLAVLWVLAALAAVAAAGLAAARLGFAATRNRIAMSRGEWAAQACGEILLARYAQTGQVRDVDSVDLGRGTWCRVLIDDPSAKLNLNTADAAQLSTLLRQTGIRVARADSLAEGLLAWRSAQRVSQDPRGPLAAVAQLRSVAGFSDSLVARLTPFTTVEGAGRVNVNVAPGPVLATVPGLTPGAVAALLRRRGAGRPVRTADELSGVLSPTARGTLYARYAAFVREAAFTSAQLVAIAEGGVRAAPVTVRIRLTVVPTPGRLAIIRRQAE